MALVLRGLLLAAPLSSGIAHAMQTPLGQMPQDKLAAAGAELYANRCSGCHGEELRNMTGGQVFDLRRLHSDDHDRFVNSVISGKDNMPSWYGVLKPEEIKAIWAYIRSMVDR